MEKSIDWEQRRYEIAKSVVEGLAANSNNAWVSSYLASAAVEMADHLIKELRKDNN